MTDAAEPSRVGASDLDSVHRLGDAQRRLAR